MKGIRFKSSSRIYGDLPSVVLFFVFTCRAMAQINAEDWIKENDPGIPEEESAPLEYLQWLQDHPIDLNRATVESLCRIPGIDISDAARIVEFRSSNGPYQSKDELVLVPNLPVDVARRLQEFVMVPERVRTGNREVHLELRARTLRDLQMREGFRTGVYPGSPDKSYARLTGSMEEAIEAGILVEKDAGETPSSGFLSGYVHGMNLPGVDQLIVGDFRFESGEGLVFWQGGGFGGNLVETGARNPRGLIPHRSTDEFQFLRGVGMSTTVSIGKIPFSLTGFVSTRRLSGTVDQSGVVTSLQESGLFRTESERAKRDAVGEKIVGGSITAEPARSLTLGIVFSVNRFDRSLVLDDDTTSGRSNAVVGGLHARWITGSSELAGEVAIGREGVPAWLVRGGLRFGRAGRMVALYHQYPPDFNGMHSAGYGARSDTRNERGFYLGFFFRPRTGISASLFVDQFAFPMRTESIPVPAHGYDAGINVDAQLDARNLLSFRGSRGKSPEVSAGTEDGKAMWELGEVDQYRIRVTYVHEATKSIRLKTRFERTGIKPGFPDGKGTMVFQDVRFVSGGGFSAEGRLVFFQTNSYDTRIYEFENDVPGAFSVPVLYGTGKRWYVVARYEVFSGALLSLKYSETQKEGVRELGSGPGEIEGDKENRITIQMDIGV